MTEVPASTALETVRQALRVDVLPHVTDPHAAATLRACVTIVAEVRAQIDIGDRWCAEVLEWALPLTANWPAALETVSASAAAQVADHLRQAAALADPEAAHDHLMKAVSTCFMEIWRQGTPDPSFLSALRRVARWDAEARAGLVS